MGTWLGHAAPGTFFICFSLWWLITSLRSYYHSLSKAEPYTNSLVRQCCWKKGCHSRFSLDSWFLILVVTIGAVMEIVTSILATQTIIMGNLQHFTMYISFGLFAVTSILVHHKVKFVPKGAEYMALMMALGVELVLFRFHLHGRHEVDTHLHMLLVYTIAASIAVVGIEMLYPQSITVLLARCYGALLQGTWFHQIGVSLYTPYALTEEQLKNPESIMLMTLIFAWHMIGCLMAMVLVSGLVYCCSPSTHQADYYNDNTTPVAHSHCVSDNEDDHHKLLPPSSHNSLS